MKKIFLISTFIFLFLININYVNAEYSVESVGGGKPSTEYPSDNTYDNGWTIKSFDMSFGLKVTIYDITNPKTPYKTKVFFNNKTMVNELNNSSVFVSNVASQRLTNIVKEIVWKEASSNYFDYLKFPKYYRSSVGYTLQELLNVDASDNMFTKLGFREDEITSKNIDNFIVVVEPAMVVTNGKGQKYFGTYWEFQELYEKEPPTASENFAYRFFNVMRALGVGISIDKGELTSTTAEKIWGFLSNFKNFQNAVVNGAKGISMITLKNLTPPDEYIPNAGEPIKCTTTVREGTCEQNLLLTDSDSRECVVNNEKRWYKNVGDCGAIYCSMSLKSDIDYLRQSFLPVVYSGRYFKLNNVAIDVSKTCYLVKKDTSASCKDWTQYIKEEEAGTASISLTMGTNHKFDLIKDNNKSTFAVNCAEYDRNGVCSKAVVQQHIEYGLENMINRYISIGDMAGVNTFMGHNVIDLGGPHLTTPIYYPNSGLPNESGELMNNNFYVISFENTLASKHLTGNLIPVNTTKEVDGKTIEYKQEGELMLYQQPFSFGCVLKAKQDANEGCEPYTCCDEIDRIVLCPNPCDSIMGCDEEGTPFEPSCRCPYGKCCDADCNVYQCESGQTTPGGFPNVVYRSINLKQPFPGIDGLGRDYGDNWKKTAYDENGNIITKPSLQPYNVTEYYITNNRGYADYEVYKAEPLYVINLDYNTIKAIRKYNDSNSYNDFTLQCKSTQGTECISEFLHGDVIKPGGLIAKGTCKDITRDNFYSCITRKGA